MKNFILASRPKTLLAGGVPPLVAYTYFYGRTGENQSLYLILCVLGALFIQLATNFFNDVPDPFDVVFPAHGDTSYSYKPSRARRCRFFARHGRRRRCLPPCRCR